MLHSDISNLKLKTPTLGYNISINPIFGGGGQIYLKFPLSSKISKIEAESRGHGVSKFKLGHM